MHAHPHVAVAAETHPHRKGKHTRQRIRHSQRALAYAAVKFSFAELVDSYLPVRFVPFTSAVSCNVETR